MIIDYMRCYDKYKESQGALHHREFFLGVSGGFAMRRREFIGTILCHINCT